MTSQVVRLMAVDSLVASRPCLKRACVGTHLIDRFQRQSIVQALYMRLYKRHRLTCDKPVAICLISSGAKIALVLCHYDWSSNISTLSGQPQDIRLEVRDKVVAHLLQECTTIALEFDS